MCRKHWDLKTVEISDTGKHAKAASFDQNCIYILSVQEQAANSINHSDQCENDKVQMDSE